MSGKTSDVDLGSETPTPSLAVQSHVTSLTSSSNVEAHDVKDVLLVVTRLAEVLRCGGIDPPVFCFQHMRGFLKDSVAGIRAMVLSNGPHYQVQVVKGHASDAVSKNIAPGMSQEHLRALCWEALVLSVLAIIKPFVTPGLRYVVSSTPSSLELVLDRCDCSIEQISTEQQAPHSRVAALSGAAPFGPPVPFPHAIALMFQIAVALSAAHSLNQSHQDHPGETILAVIHGNVQPANVLLRSSDTMPVICGWSHSMVHWRDKAGLQHVFSAAEVPDDPVHNAPELQAAEDPHSALEALSDRTDVWGFALVSLFLLTGKGPYHGMRLSRVIRARDNHEPPYDPAEASEANVELQHGGGRAVLSLLGHCLAEDPEERPSMGQCVHALTPLVSHFLKDNAQRLHETAQKTIQQLRAQLRRATEAAARERAVQAEQQAEAAQQLPTFVAENVAVSLHDLCQEAADRQHAESYVLQLGSRPVMAAGDHQRHPGARYRLPCGVAGGVFHLHDGDVLSIFGTRCSEVECRRVAPAVPPRRPPPMLAGLHAGAADGPPPPPPPRVSFFGDRAEVVGVAAQGCGVYVSAACALLEGCRVAGSGDMIGVEVVEARGDPREYRELRMRSCEVSDCRIGLLVKGVPSMVKLEACQFRDSREHNIWLQKVATRACVAELDRVEATGAQRSGLLVETSCRAVCRGCTFMRNSHYGIQGARAVQVLPKGEARIADCQLEHNRRGRSSGNGVFLLHGPK